MVILPAIGFAIFIAAHLADENSLLGSMGSTVSFLFFLAPLAMALMPERAPPAAEEGPKPVPRTLSRDILNDTTVSLSLPQRIEAATELSKLASRTFGILSIRIGEIDRVAEALDLATAEEVGAKASAAIRKQLRSTDRAIVMGADEIVVCLPLIAVRSDLNSIAARLSRAISKAIAPAEGEDDFVAPIDLGVAMHPIDGYRGDDLLASAQANAKAARAARLGRPTRRGSADPVPVMPPRKPVRAPRGRRQTATAR